MLQCVTMCRSVLQCVAVCCSLLVYMTEMVTCMMTLQCAAVCYIASQRIAAYSFRLQNASARSRLLIALANSHAHIHSEIVTDTDRHRHRDSDRHADAYAGTLRRVAKCLKGSVTPDMQQVCCVVVCTAPCPIPRCTRCSGCVAMSHVAYMTSYVAPIS